MRICSLVCCKLELEGVFDVDGFGDVELAVGLDLGADVGPVYLRRLGTGQVCRVDITLAARPATSGEAN